MTTIVKSLSIFQKDHIVTEYTAKRMNMRQLAKHHDTSERTIGRVLEERGLATPVPRLKGEAYRAMKLLKEHHLTVDDLARILSRTVLKDFPPATAALLKAPAQPVQPSLHFGSPELKNHVPAGFA